MPANGSGPIAVWTASASWLGFEKKRDPRPPVPAEGPLESGSCHPCCHVHRRPGFPRGAPPQSRHDDTPFLASMQRAILRHRHHPSYCKGDELSDVCTCRFHLPRGTCILTRVVVEEKLHKTDKLGKAVGALRRVKLSFSIKTNDGWMAKHNRVLLAVHGANHDIAVLIDADEVLFYVTKYGTKAEASTTSFSQMVLQGIDRGEFRGVENVTATAIRSLFIQCFTGTEKGEAELAALLTNRCLSVNSHKRVYVNLKNDHRGIAIKAAQEEEREEGEVEVDQDAGDELELRQTIIDLYALRMHEKQWKSKAHFRSLDQGDLKQMPLAKFVTKFYAKNSALLEEWKGKPRVIVWLPDYWASPLSPGYAEWCYFMLLRYKAWTEEPESLLDVPLDFAADEMEVAAEGEEGEVPAIADENAVPVESAEEKAARLVKGYVVTSINFKANAKRIGRAWRHFRATGLAAAPLRMQERLAEMYEDPDGEDVDELVAANGYEGADGEAEDDDYMTALVAKANNGQHNDGSVEWTKDHAWHQLTQVYSDETLNYITRGKVGLDAWERACVQKEFVPTAPMYGPEPPPPPPIVLNEEQQLAKDIIMRMVADRRRGVKTTPRGLVLLGGGGTGKSTVVAALQALLDPPPEKGILAKASFSAVAAINIDGDTIHSMFGKTPSNMSQDIRGDALRELQGKFRLLEVLVLDEYSYLNQALLLAVDKHLRAAKACNEPFGGIIVVLAGDPGQIPCVSGKILWAPGAGKALYNNFFSLSVKLVESNRLDKTCPMHVDFERILNGLRSATLTEEDWKLLVDYCGEAKIKERIGEAEFKEKFLGGEATHYFFDNKSRAELNVSQMCKSGRAILRLDAVNSPASAKGLSAETFQHIPNVAYMTHKSYHAMSRGEPSMVFAMVQNGGRWILSLPRATARQICQLPSLRRCRGTRGRPISASRGARSGSCCGRSKPSLLQWVAPRGCAKGILRASATA